MPMSSPPPQEFGKPDEEVAKEAGEGPEGRAGGEAEGEGEGLLVNHRKRQRLADNKVDATKIVDIQSLPANPLHLVPFRKQTPIQIKSSWGTKCM